MKGRLTAVVTAGAAVLALGALAALAGCGLMSVADKAAENAKQFINPWNLAPGTCYDNKSIDSGKIESISSIPCTDPHNSQIVDVITYPAATNWGELSTKAQADCSKAFESKLQGPVYEMYTKNGDAYDGAYLYPQSTDWKTSESNKVACVLQSKQPMTASAVQ